MAWLRRLNWPLVGIAICLTLVGIAAIARATPDDVATCFWRKQAQWALVSLVAMALVLLPHYRLFERCAYTLLLLSVPVLVLILIGAGPLTPVINGARRWIRVAGVQLQPSELVKIAYICALAKYLMFRENYRTLKGLVLPFVLTLVPVALIVKQPDLGTSLVFLPVLFAMLYAAGARVKHLLLVVLLGVAAMPAFWKVMSSEQKSRILGWVQQTDWEQTAGDDGYHLWHSKLAIGSGGAFGRDPEADSWVELGYLPEARTDFIFAVVGESWGFVGGGLVVLLYLLMCLLGLGIAGNTREPFGRLVAVGVVVLLASQMVVNVGMTVGLMPITGMTLPFLSYGGSSLLSSFIALGLVLNIGSRKVLVVSREPFVFDD